MGDWVLPTITAACLLTTAVVIVLWQIDRWDRDWWRERALQHDALERAPRRKHDIVIVDDDPFPSLSAKTPNDYVKEAREDALIYGDDD